MIGILNAYHFDANDTGYQLDYSRIFIEFVKSIYPEKADAVREYKVAQGEFPQSVNECELWFITGSPKSVYEDIPWIHNLRDFVVKLDETKVKTIAICFGHQMVAHALGGKVSKSPRGWGVGIRNFEMLIHKPWMDSPGSTTQKLSLLFSHQDQVEVLPPTAELLAQDEFCPFQMMQIGEHILTMQGHPEFTVNFARERLISRRDKMSAETFDKAMKSYAEASDFQLMIGWIRKFVNLRT